MPLLEEIANAFRRECADDYVGVWQISRALKEVTGEARTEEILSVVAALLQHHAITVGQFEEGRFVEWAGSREERVDRVRRELLQLGTEPDLGDVAWLVERRPRERSRHPGEAGPVPQDPSGRV